MESVVSVAVRMAEPPTVDCTVKVATPAAEVVTEAGKMVSVVPPRLDESVTAFPGSGLALASCRITVMMEVVAPSAATVVGFATTVELPATLLFTL